jgi:excinuclease ABC subunit C
MMHEVVNIKYIITDSVLEAVILESVYIKKFQPVYNVDGKDDKSWNYIMITNEPYPQVYTMREHEYVRLGVDEIRKDFLHISGPYPGLNAKVTMKLLRRLFYISTCTPRAKRPCLYRQMGQCLGVCTGDITSRDYRRIVIRPLITFLSGGKKKLIASFEKQMVVAARNEQFEEAARLRNQSRALTRIQDIALINKDFFSDLHETDVHGKEKIRIEGYDISNLGKTGKVGSMVVFTAEGPVKHSYRKFKIKTVEGQSDVDCLEEVLVRRFKHAEWEYPTVLLIDGGLPQVNRTREVLTRLGITIPIVGIAKGPERKRNDFILGNTESEFVNWVNTHQELLIRVRDEAHRFAITYQRSLRRI